MMMLRRWILLSCFAVAASLAPRPAAAQLAVFPDPVAPATASTAAGRKATVFLDELGREVRTELPLGTDYPNQTLIVGKRIYDDLGRVVFEADPYPSTQTPDTAYGTTRFFNGDGTPSCILRGNGPQPVLIRATDETSERYPTCVRRTFQAHTEVVTAQDAASLLAGSPQAEVTTSSTSTAIGRLVSRSTWQGTARLEHATLTHDWLGHLHSMTRYQNAAAASNPVTSSRHFDSLGQVLELDEPDSVPQLHTHSHWGELLDTRRLLTANGMPTLSRLVNTYDALGRVIHREQQDNGVTDAETVNDYVYDEAVAVGEEDTLDRFNFLTC